MNNPPLSNHFKNRSPSSIRRAQIEFSKREDVDSIDVINSGFISCKLEIMYN